MTSPAGTGPRPHGWAMETMQLINKLTPDIKDKTSDADWFLLRQRLEEFESRALAPTGPAAPPRDLELVAHDILGPREGVLCNDDEVWKWMHTRIPAEVFHEIIRRITVALASQRVTDPVSLAHPSANAMATAPYCEACDRGWFHFRENCPRALAAMKSAPLGEQKAKPSSTEGDL